MTKKQIRNFSAEEKTKIVLELLKEEVTISQLSSKYEVSSNSISQSIGYKKPMNVYLDSIQYHTQMAA